MTATLTTAAVLLVPFLAVVVVGALAVAIHDAIARAWAQQRTSAWSGATGAASRRVAAVRGIGRRDTPVVFGRSTVAAASAPRSRTRRAPVVLVR